MRYSFAAAAIALTLLVGCADLTQPPTPARSAEASASRAPVESLVLRELPLPAGLVEGRAFDINVRGTVVGAGGPRLGDLTTALRWSNRGEIRVLTVPDGWTGAQARGINDLEESVGVAVSPEGLRRAVSWERWGKFRVLPNLPGGTESVAEALNNDGDAAGWSTTPTGERRAVVWPHGGGVRDLGVLPGKTNSEAVAINSRGDVAGTSWISDPNTDGRAVFWRKGDRIKLIDTRPLGASRATGLSDHRTVVGLWDTDDPGDGFLSVGFAWSSQEEARDINTLPTIGQLFDISSDVNNHGELGILGDEEEIPFRVTLTDSGDVIEPLPFTSPPWDPANLFPVAINDRGTIAGFGFIRRPTEPFEVAVPLVWDAM